MNATVREPARDLPVFGEYGVVVVGGGPAGIAAARATARCGSSAMVFWEAWAPLAG